MDDFEQRLAEFDQPKVQIPSPAIENRIGGDLKQCKRGFY